jgi:hypothetical protein
MFFVADYLLNIFDNLENFGRTNSFRDNAVRMLDNPMLLATK